MSAPSFCLLSDIRVENMGIGGLIELWLLCCEGYFYGGVGNNVGFYLMF